MGNFKDRNGNPLKISSTNVAKDMDIGKMPIHSLSSSAHNPHNHISKDASELNRIMLENQNSSKMLVED